MSGGRMYGFLAAKHGVQTDTRIRKSEMGLTILEFFIVSV
jgi:hypothetical protein